MSLRRLFSVAAVLAAFALPAYSATQWAIVVGVSEYKLLPKNQWLNYADDDAKLFADYLKSPAVGVPAANLRLLTNADATTANIKNLMGSWLPDRVQPDDMVYVYFAGHGVVDKQGDAYFITNDTDPDKLGLYASAYSMLDFKRVLGRLKYKHLIVISDACHSGSIGTETDTSRDLEVVRINDAFKGIAAENANVASSDFILTAAGSNEKSYESDKWDGGHGAFTYFLVDGLKGKADRDANGKVSANEIYEYVRTNVRRETEDKQNPIIASTKFDGNLILAAADGSVGTIVGTNPGVPPSSSRESGSLVLTAAIGGIRYSVDNDPKGTIDPTAPKPISLPAGLHTVTAQKDGYKPFSVNVTVPGASQVDLPITLIVDGTSSAPDLTTRFTDNQHIIGVDDAGAILEFEAIFSSLVSTRSERPLFADEQDLVNGVFVALVEQYRKVRPASEAGVLAQNYLRIFSSMPDSILNKLGEEFRTSIAPSVSSLQFEIQPAQSILEFDSELYGPVDPAKKFIVRPGAHTVRISRPGYKTLEKQIDLSAGQTESVKDRLGLAGITVFVFSDTPGVQVMRDGKLVAAVGAYAEAQAKLRPDQRERLRQAMDRRPANPPLQFAVLTDLPADSADFSLSFTRPKYSTQEGQVTVAANRDRIYESAGDYIWDGVVHLEKLMGALDITSFPSGADVLIDDKKVGTTPFQLAHEIGDFDVLLRSGVWKHQERVSIKDRATVKIDAKLRTPIVYLGVHSTAVDAQKYRDLDTRIQELIPKTMTNYIGEPRNPGQYEYMREFVAEATSGKGNVDQRLKTLKERFNSELFVIGYFPTENAYLSNTLSFLLFSTFTSGADVRQVETNRPGEIENLFKELDSVKLTPADLFRPYLGLTTVDTLLAGHELVVLTVDAGGPAARAGLAKGDTILSLNGAPGNSLKLAQWTDGNPVGGQLQIEVQNASGRKTLTLKSEPLPRFVVKPGMKTPVNSLMAQFDSLRFSLPAKPGHESNIVLLNQALAHMATQNWARAIEVLNGFVDAADNASILRPAVDYYRGFCFEQLNDSVQAGRAYDAAAQQKITLLQSELAFDFQTLARWRLEYLK